MVSPGRILVTGGTGFVGRQVVAALTDRGVPLRLVVRAEAALPDHVLASADRVVVTTDLFSEDAAWWERVCDGVDVVVHVAWYTEPGKYLQASVNLQCLTGTIALSRGAVAGGVRRIVGVGTCFEYDLSGGYLSTRTPLRPTTLYAGAKAATYLALSPWLQGAGVGFAWCRLFYLYGEYEDERRLVPYIRARLAAGEPAELTSGNQVRDFMNVREAGSRIAEVASSDRSGAMNICSGVPVTIRELAERIADEFGRRDLLRFGVRPDNLVDPPVVVGIPD